MDSAGAIAGPLAALVLLARFGIRSVFWAAAIPGALCVLVALVGIRETKLASTGRDKGARIVPASEAGEKAERIRLPASFYVVLVAVALFFLANSSYILLG